MGITNISRRELLQTTGVMTAGLIGVNAFENEPVYADGNGFGYGPLVADPNEILDLPKGFSYTVFSRTGDWMDDDLKVPGAHDGMAAFPGPRGLTVLVRNHELSPVEADKTDSRLLGHVPTDAYYDFGAGEKPCIGGTTTLLYDTKNKRLVKHFTSLIGTIRNCAGGLTPWRSWLTCEENVDRKGDTMQQDHGYVFEVPVTSNQKITAPIPYKEMGRFNHEAVAVDSRTGIVYLTEDRDDGLFYRYLPHRPGDLGKGGKLQALRMVGFGTSSRNWPNEGFIPVRRPIPVEWVDIENPESPDDDLRRQGYEDKKCAKFARGEGIWYDSGHVYFACTSGGPNQKGQVFRYTPSEKEGHSGEWKQRGFLSIYCQPNDINLLQMADNLVVAPWGDVIICEDGGPVNRLIGITPEGKLYRFASNSLNGSEFAGSCFSPDGTTLFVNIQTPGMTLAITGPWSKLERNA